MEGKELLHTLAVAERLKIRPDIVIHRKDVRKVLLNIVG